MKIFSTIILLLNTVILAGFILLLYNAGNVIAMIYTPAFFIIILLPVLIITLIGLIICYNVRIKNRWQTSGIGRRIIWNPVINLIVILGLVIFSQF